MEQDVYIDILFLINFSMDYLCIYICTKILKRKLILSKMLIASAVGGFYSIISLFLLFTPWFGLLADAAVCLIMCAIVYLQKGRSIGSYFLSSFLFLGISMMTGGCMTAIFNLLNRLDLPLEVIEADGISTYLFAALAIIAGIISLKSGEVISRRAPVKECRLKLGFAGNEFEFLGFADSGNLVRDPLSGRAVIFVEREIIEKKVSLSFLEDYANGVLTPNAPCKNLRLIALKTASGTSIAVAALPESLHIEFNDKKGKIKFYELDALISPTDIGKSAQGYTAIIPSEIIKP